MLQLNHQTFLQISGAYARWVKSMYNIQHFFNFVFRSAGCSCDFFHSKGHISVFIQRFNNISPYEPASLFVGSKLKLKHQMLRQGNIRRGILLIGIFLFIRILVFPLPIADIIILPFFQVFLPVNIVFRKSRITLRSFILLSTICFPAFLSFTARLRRSLL